ncbi:MAG: rhamnulokinase [Anaerolineales bacterium]|nr:rhamnulokinase [Anaerolineales bacterium]MDW8276655.1 rhamnulokinase family protein [Anaerolineales bacterium]
MPHYLALDLGAESGRAMLGTLEADHLTLTETHRFPNGAVSLPEGLYWDVLRLWDEIQRAIALTTARSPLDSLGLDTWGVDFALLDTNGALLANPRHYRDPRTEGVMSEAFQRVPREEIFAQTGIQFLSFNTLYQLLALSRQQPHLLQAASTFLTIPDLFNYWLTGRTVCEFTNATTTQCFDPRRRNWAHPLLESFGLPTHILPPVCEPGTILGEYSAPSLAQFIAVIAPACHDTGSAVVAIPAEGRNFAWLSSGTWSIMGVESDSPCLEAHALEYNFTNEGGVFGTWRLSRNIMGLWLIQECRREWGISYDEITRLAAEARPFLAVIDPDAEPFFRPGGMSEKIRQFCARSGQAVPQTRGEVARVVLESLALKYRLVLEQLEALTRKQLSPVHIIGGGTKNRLLNQLTADCTGRPVVAGPVEATAIGNLLMQALTLRHLTSLTEARALVRHSFPLEMYQPVEHAGWEIAYRKLLNFV